MDDERRNSCREMVIVQYQNIKNSSGIQSRPGLIVRNASNLAHRNNLAGIFKETCKIFLSPRFVCIFLERAVGSLHEEFSLSNRKSPMGDPPLFTSLFRSSSGRLPELKTNFVSWNPYSNRYQPGFFCFIHHLLYHLSFSHFSIIKWIAIHHINKSLKVSLVCFCWQNSYNSLTGS